MSLHCLFVSLDNIYFSSYTAVVELNFRKIELDSETIEYHH
jgi:hypothetical protein